MYYTLDLFGCKQLEISAPVQRTKRYLKIEKEAKEVI